MGGSTALHILLDLGPCFSRCVVCADVSNGINRDGRADEHISRNAQNNEHRWTPICDSGMHQEWVNAPVE